MYHPGPDLDLLIAHRRDLWYQQEELKQCKKKALLVSKEAQRYGLGTILTNTYSPNRSNSNSNNMDTTGTRMDNDCHADNDIHNDDEVQLALNTWSRNGSSRRGLERWINDEYAAKRAAKDATTSRPTFTTFTTTTTTP
jgi:hypothetical protein